MPMRHKFESILIVCVAAAFQWFFMFTKHEPGLRPVIPFGDDPYDALGSFATIVDLLLCPLLLWRAFRPYKRQAPSTSQIQYLLRTEAAVPLLILVTLAADAIAMMRHPRMWIGAASRDELLGVLVGMAAIAGAALWVIQSSPENRNLRHDKRAIIPASIVSALFLFTLAVYPEALINRFTTHLLTILLGDLLLFAPVAALLPLLFPSSLAMRQENVRSRISYSWSGIIAFGLLIGGWLFLAEITEGGGPLPPLRMRMLVASVYIGLTIAGLLIAVALLRNPLGLARANMGPNG